VGTVNLNSTRTKLPISILCKANPALTANITTYQYSLDGSTWYTMTYGEDTVIENVSFTTSGTMSPFNWNIKEDLGNDIYNKNIYIRLQAASGGMVSNTLSTSFYFAKEVVNSEIVREKTSLPKDYVGVSGSSLLESAPKLKNKQ
jgi:hypothetical protein